MIIQRRCCDHSTHCVRVLRVSPECPRLPLGLCVHLSNLGISGRPGMVCASGRGWGLLLQESGRALQVRDWSSFSNKSIRPNINSSEEGERRRGRGRSGKTLQACAVRASSSGAGTSPAEAGKGPAEAPARSPLPARCSKGRRQAAATPGVSLFPL